MKLHFYHGEFSQHQNGDFQNFIREEVKQFAIFVGQCLTKTSLKTLEIEVQIIQPPNESTTSEYSAPIIQRIVEVLRASETPMIKHCVNISLNQLKLDLEISNSELESLATVLIPKRSLKRLSLTKLNSYVGGFLSLSRLLTEGGLTELELSLNVNNFWKKKYGEANLHYQIAVGSPEMFQIPRERIYEEVFDATSSRDVMERDLNQISREDIVKKSRNHLSELLKALDLEAESCNLECRLEDEFNTVNDLYHIKVDDLVLPLPVCNGHKGKVSGFHFLFTALRDPKCGLESLYLNRCLIHRQAEYFSCLGEMILENRTLRTLKVENTFPPAEPGEARVEYTLPLLLGLQHNTTITDLDLGSLENITVNNTVFRVFSHCLSKNKTLRTLNLSCWKFELSLESETVKFAKQFLSQTKLTHLNLAECQVIIKGLPTNNAIADIPLIDLNLKQSVLENSSIEVLCLESVIISINNMPRILRSRDVLFLLNFSSLQELDVSDRPAMDRNQESQKERTVTDGTIINFFQGIQNNFGTTLEVLKMTNWRLGINKPDTAGQLKQIFTKLEKLTTISLNNINISSAPDNNEPVFLKAMIKHLPQLRKLSILNCELETDQVPTIFKILKQKVKGKKAGMITLYTKMVTEDGLEELLQCLQKSKSVKFKYDGKSGTLEIFQNKKEPLMVRMRSIKLPKKIE